MLHLGRYDQLLAAQRGNRLANDASIPAGLDWFHELSWAHYEAFTYTGECIVNNDNKDNTLWFHPFCRYGFRKMETELKDCSCSRAGESGLHCAKWSCSEKNLGVFSVLFRTEDDIEDLLEGQEHEDFDCTKTMDGACVAWTGDHKSVKEIEKSGCECREHALGKCSSWECDEYKMPRHLGFWSTYYWWIRFAFYLPHTLFFIPGLFGIIFSKRHPGRFALITLVLYVILLPFLIVTFGYDGFRYVALPFYALLGGLLAAKKWFVARRDRARQQQSEQIIERPGLSMF